MRYASPNKPNISEVDLPPEENLRLSAFERLGMERYMAYTFKLSVEQIDTKVTETGVR